MLWQCDIRVSKQTRLISLVLYGLLIFVILVWFWPKQSTFFWFTLLGLLILEFFQSQKRIVSKQGTLYIRSERQLEWAGESWFLLSAPWLLRIGVLFYLQRSGDKKSCHLWLAADSMSHAEWRYLCQWVRYHPMNQNE